MKIQKISIQNLYNTFSYEIDMKEVGNIFIITGPNGYGKTTILNILYNLSIGRLIFFYLLEFSEIKFVFDNGQSLYIKKEVKEIFSDADTAIDDERNQRVDFYIVEENEEEVAYFYLDYSLILQTTKELGQTDHYNNSYYNRNRTLSEKIETLVDSTPGFYNRISEKIKQEQFLMLLKTITCLYIPTERLGVRVGDEDSTIRGTIKRFNRQFNFIYREYLETASKLDSDMMDRIIDSKIIPYTKEEYNKKYNELNKTIEIFSNYGLDTNLKMRPYNEEKAGLLRVHLDTIEEKINVLRDYVNKIEVFSDCLNRKRFSNKYIKIEPKKGLKFLSREDEAEIDCDRLASGEKNEVIMLYNLVFGIKDSSMLLIDEPENSLHIAWQREFINDIKKIIGEKPVQVIIATHAPAIIGAQWDITYDLFENNLKNE